MSRIHGEVAPGFESVRDAFAENFAVRGEVGASVCAYLRGEPVVDLWGGVADRATGRPWEGDTLVLVFSTTKGVTAACIHALVARGVLELEAPVARYWPEFAANGKDRITLSDVLTHRAGLAAVEGDLTLEQVCAWHPVCDAIARQAPLWEPGTQHGYHVRSYGWILGEVVRRATGETLGTAIAREIAGPVAADFHVGLPEALEPRVAPIVPAPEPADPEQRALRDRFMGPDTLLGRSLNARIYAALVSQVDGTRLLAEETVARAARTQVEGPDRVIRVPMRFGLGFLLPPSLCPACLPGSFGHPGAGGSLGFADPAAQLGFGYAMSRMRLGITGDERATRLVEALYACLPG